MNLMRWIYRKLFRPVACPPEMTRARQLIAAVDAGGVPTDPGRIKLIAESLGLEVSRAARTIDTIERIRAAINRA